MRGPGSPRGADQGTRGPEAGPGWLREVGRAWPGLAAHTWGAGGLSQPSRPGAFPGGRRAGKEIPGFGYSGFFFGGFWGFDGITHDLAQEQGKEMWQQAHRLAGFISFLFLSGSPGLRVRGEGSCCCGPEGLGEGGAVPRNVD